MKKRKVFVEYGLDTHRDIMRSFTCNVLGRLSLVPLAKVHTTRFVVVKYSNRAMEMINPCNICKQDLIHSSLNFLVCLFNTIVLDGNTWNLSRRKFTNHYRFFKFSNMLIFWTTIDVIIKHTRVQELSWPTYKIWTSSQWRNRNNHVRTNDMKLFSI